MEYINRKLDRYSHSPPHQQHSHQPSGPRHSIGANRQPRRRSELPSAPHTHRKHRHHLHKMIAFSGPSSKDLDAFKKSMQVIPDQHKSSLASASKNTLEKLCDPDVLHVWETDSDIDNLLQLASVIAKLCNLSTRKEKGANVDDGCMVIIAEEKAGRNNFGRICQLVKHLTCADGKKHLEGTVAAFCKIVVVKGWNNSVRSHGANNDSEAIVKRVNIAIERVFKMGTFPSGKKKMVWHHGPVVNSLLHWIDNTTSTLRSALYAVTITGSLDLSDSVKPSVPGRGNTLLDLSCLELYAKKLGIPVVFLDPSGQLITYRYLATYMYYFGYYINTFLPSSLSRPHFHKAQDDLVTFAFQLLGASKSKYGESVVKQVKKHLDASVASRWARRCVDPCSFEKSECKTAGNSHAIHHAVQLADSPFARFAHPATGLPAFARLCVGPAASGSIGFHVAAPAQIDFKASRFRLAHPATFYIVLSAPTQDEERVTNRIQGLMMAVLERVRQEKGNPVVEAGEKETWGGVKGACAWAMKTAEEGGMPKGVAEKVKFVMEKLGRGTCETAMGSGKENEDGIADKGVSEAARANADAIKAFGAGGNMFGQPQPQAMAMGYGGPQTQMGLGQQQQPMVYPPHQGGVAAPQNSPVMVPPPQMYVPQQGYGVPVPPPGYSAPAPPQGYAPRHGRDAGYAQTQGVGNAMPPPPMPTKQSGYAQSMGGPWK
jgi:hypothetical protein